MGRVWFRGTVAAKKGTRYRVDYDDGDWEEMYLRELVKCLKEGASQVVAGDVSTPGADEENIRGPGKRRCVRNPVYNCS